MENSPALDERLHEKTARFDCYVQGKSSFHWVCIKNSHGEHEVELKVLGPQIEFFAKAEHENLYKCIDLVVDKIERQFEKYKSKKSNPIHNKDKIDFHKAS